MPFYQRFPINCTDGDLLRDSHRMEGITNNKKNIQFKSCHLIKFLALTTTLQFL